MALIFLGGAMKFSVRSKAGLELPPGKLGFVAFDDALAGFGYARGRPLMDFSILCVKSATADGDRQGNRPTASPPRSRARRCRAAGDLAGAARWHFGDIVKLLALIGQRAREISELRWNEIDLARDFIMLPGSAPCTCPGDP
jgi:hypothetical protein